MKSRRISQTDGHSIRCIYMQYVHVYAIRWRIRQCIFTTNRQTKEQMKEELKIIRN